MDGLETYSHGSVLESPSGDRVRSELLPGANTPTPCPRVATIHGSLNVILNDKIRRDGRENCIKIPIFNPTPKSIKAELIRQYISAMANGSFRRCNIP